MDAAPGSRLVAIAAALGVAACGAAAASGPMLATGPVLHSLSRCPARFGTRPFGSDAAGLSQVLVPAGARRARLCVYASLDPKPRRYGRLVARRLVSDRRKLTRAAARLDALPAPRAGASSCPGLPRIPFVVILGYRRRPPVAVTVYVDNTCFLVTNGHKVADASYVSADPVLRLLGGG